VSDAIYIGGEYYPVSDTYVRALRSVHFRSSNVHINMYWMGHIRRVIRDNAISLKCNDIDIFCSARIDDA